ncbi:MAG: multiprotein bridging factor aMBF1 [Candidatus Micrarchaeaceae archaeon]
MYDCEICGKKTESLYIIDVEGAELTTCKKCAEGKNVIEIMEENINNKKHNPKKSKEETPEVLEIIDNYGDIIRNARESMGVPVKVLAEMINEKESMLIRIEHGRLLPSDKVIYKLEKNLGIELKTTVVEKTSKEKKDPDSPITLGDAAGFKK